MIIRRNWLPVATCVLLLVQSGQAHEPVAAAHSPDFGRLDVQSAWGSEGGRITSQQPDEHGKDVLHGVQIVVGPKNLLREFAVYNQGRVEQRTQFYPGAKTFRYQRREHNGDGYEVIYAPMEKAVAGGKAFTQEIVAQGSIKNDRRWDGTFLLWETVPGGFARQFVMVTFREGRRTESSAFPLSKLGLKESDDGSWPWNTPEWPLNR
jgi:hypothetical protein